MLHKHPHTLKKPTHSDFTYDGRGKTKWSRDGSFILLHRIAKNCLVMNQVVKVPAKSLPKVQSLFKVLFLIVCKIFFFRFCKLIFMEMKYNTLPFICIICFYLSVFLFLCLISEQMGLFTSSQYHVLKALKQ